MQRNKHQIIIVIIFLLISLLGIALDTHAYQETGEDCPICKTIDNLSAGVPSALPPLKPSTLTETQLAPSSYTLHDSARSTSPLHSRAPPTISL